MLNSKKANDCVIAQINAVGKNGMFFTNILKNMILCALFCTRVIDNSFLVLHHCFCIFYENDIEVRELGVGVANDSVDSGFLTVDSCRQIYRQLSTEQKPPPRVILSTDVDRCRYMSIDVDKCRQNIDDPKIVLLR